MSEHNSAETASVDDLLDESGNIDKSAVMSITHTGGPGYNNVAAETCARWRDKAIGASNIETVVKGEDYKQSTVCKHITGKCNHDCDAPPLTFNRTHQESRSGPSGIWVVDDE